MNFEKQIPKPLDSMSRTLLEQSPLHFACYAGDCEVVDLLLDSANSGISIGNNNNNIATSSNDETGTRIQSTIESLISEEDTLINWTPAHWAAYYGQMDCLVRFHLRPNVGFDTPTKKTHLSPLHMAAQSGAILCLKWLLQCGASINRQDSIGETPLHKAAKAGNSDSAQMLVSHGAFIDLKNQEGYTAVDLAEISNYPSLAMCIRRSKEPQPNIMRFKSTSDFNADNNCNNRPISDLTNLSPFLTSSHPSRPNQSAPIVSNRPYGNPPENRLWPPPSAGHKTDITMNGVSIGNSHPRMIEVGRVVSETLPSSNRSSHQNSVDMEAMPSLALSKAKRSLKSVEESYHEEHASGNLFNTSPKRRCFGFVSGNEMEHINSEFSDACNNNNNSISCDDFMSTNSAPPQSACYSPNAFPFKSQNASPVLARSSEMEHQETVTAEQGYDSSVMWAMEDDLH